MTCLRTGGAPPGGAPCPAGAGAQGPRRPVTGDTGNPIVAGQDAPPGRREAPDRAAWQATERGPVLIVCHPRAPERAGPVRRPAPRAAGDRHPGPRVLAALAGGTVLAAAAAAIP
jgi:hypothetical protein